MRILLVDDGAEVRADDHLDLLIADFAMPGVTGSDLAVKVTEAARQEQG